MRVKAIVFIVLRDYARCTSGSRDLGNHPRILLTTIWLVKIQENFLVLRQVSYLVFSFALVTVAEMVGMVVCQGSPSFSDSIEALTGLKCHYTHGYIILILLQPKCTKQNQQRENKGAKYGTIFPESSPRRVVEDI